MFSSVLVIIVDNRKLTMTMNGTPKGRTPKQLKAAHPPISVFQFTSLLNRLWFCDVQYMKLSKYRVAITRTLFFLVENSLSPAIVYFFSYFWYSALRSGYVNCLGKFPLRSEMISRNLGMFFPYFTNTCFWTKAVFYVKSSIILLKYTGNLRQIIY